MVAAKTTPRSGGKVTYATLALPPDDPRHVLFDKAVAAARAAFGRTYAMVIGGRERSGAELFTDASPIDTSWTLGRFPRGTESDMRDAVAAAAGAFPAWRDFGWPRRVRVMRRAAALIGRRAIAIAAVMTLEVGKSRTEALADVQEAADLVAYYADQLEKSRGFVRAMKAESRRHHNTSVLKPYGVWAVISPFNFPCALAGGPIGAALVAGNTVVFKPASDTPLVGRLLADCFLESGLPDGALNFITGPGGVIGRALAADPDVAGVTFTGSFEIGMGLYRAHLQTECAYPRPCIVEMGGKNAAIVSGKADLETAAQGIVRSAFGLQGQKCSAASRVFIDRRVLEPFLERLAALTDALTIGDPSRRDVWFGPVINAKAYADFGNYAAELGASSRILRGGGYVTEKELAKGYFCAPTISVGLPEGHRLWNTEMFLPITTVAAVEDLDEALRRANDVCYGLTSGFYSRDKREIETFLKRIEAGVAYVNRGSGATTGAWPGYQPFGGWKASGSTGKSSGGPYYLPQYMREQSQTIVDPSVEDLVTGITKINRLIGRDTNTSIGKEKL
jgi:1-pyrroline-5-carboxylate dehydrogenase